MRNTTNNENLSTNTPTSKSGIKTLPDKYYYLDVQVEFEETTGKKQPVFTKELIKLSVSNAIKKLYGELGSAATIDVIFLDQATKRIILRCPSCFYVKLHSSLTLATHYEGHDCYFQVHKASSTLISLDCHSRTYSFSKEDQQL
ncbi:uncharacterized protein LOC124196638 [Daphnia pulex]|uniref:uncharacterized protein LOC124196638 n=1 Tax=Daphnia pulex TaxID=6669 RepID=UPI001EDDC987|nr:uncharacterized protein LOC124196638 [Daphnia pulex]XP_046642754.1 uncharacterized protein LOC124327800 [Daphnia pulicaria]